MIKHEVKFYNLDGVEVSETLYFHFNQAELLELEISHEGGLSNVLQDIVEQEQPYEIYKMMKDIIGMAYGVRSDDGKRFIKNEGLRDDFLKSEAFSEFIMQLLGDAKFAAEFFRSLIPQEVAKKETPALPQDKPKAEQVAELKQYLAALEATD